jgi:hypothetical protein
LDEEDADVGAAAAWPLIALIRAGALLGSDRRVEVKIRCDGFRELYRWLDGADLLIVRANRAGRWSSSR